MGIINTARMPRIIIANLETGEGYEMPFVPETLEEQVDVVRSTLEILGLPHNRRQYTGTTSHQIPGLEFFFRGTTPEEVRNIHEGRKFLLSLTAPRAAADTVRTGAPPRFLFVWPQLFRMTCELDSLRIRHEKFNTEGLTTIFRATIGFQEVRDVRLTSEEIRETGTLRTNSTTE